MSEETLRAQLERMKLDLDEKVRQLAKKDRQLAKERERRLAEESARRLVEERERRLVEESARRLEEEREKRLAEKDRQLAEERRLVEEREKRLAEKDRQLAEKDRLAEESARQLAEERERRLAEERERRLVEEREKRLVEERERELKELKEKYDGLAKGTLKDGPLPKFKFEYATPSSQWERKRGKEGKGGQEGKEEEREDEAEKVQFVPKQQTFVLEAVPEQCPNASALAILADHDPVRTEPTFIVVTALQEVVAWLGLRLKVMYTASVARDVMPDGLVVTDTWGTPVAPIEVKRSKGNPFSDNNGFELYQQMAMVSGMSGIHNVLGILTTYETWRFCWLENTDSGLLQGIEMTGQTSPHKNDKRLCFAEFEYNSPKMVQALVSWLKKVDKASGEQGLAAEAMLVPRDGDKYKQNVRATAEAWKAGVFGRVPVSFLGDRERVAKVVLGRDSWMLSSRVITLQHGGKTYHEIVRLDKMPKPNATEFFLIRPLGSGLHGSAFLATTNAGAGAVLKFFKGSDETAEKEKTCWQLQLPKMKSTIRLVKLWGRTALVMPVVRCFENDEECKKNADAIRHCLARLLAAGIKHGDVQPRHIGHLEGKPNTVVAIDFGNATIGTKGSDTDLREQMSALGLRTK